MRRLGCVAAEIAPCFIDNDGRRTDTIVLACTHYPLLRDRFERLAAWPVDWVDPAPAIARRVVDLIGHPTAGVRGRVRAVFTSKRPLPAGLVKALAAFGVADPAAV